MTTEQDPYFVQVNAPDLVRISLLESSKYILHSLQSYYKISTLRKEKKETIDVLKGQIKELILVMDKLEKILPYQVDLLKEALEVKPTSKKSASSPKKTTLASIAPSSKLDKLNSALADIEEKLSAFK
jgi:hypothetical protein